MPLQNFVRMRKEDHTYWDTNGKSYISWSSFVKTFQIPFDRSIAKNCAGNGKYAEMNEAQVLASWNKKRDDASDHGTRIHDTIDHYSKNYEIIEGNEDLVPMVNSVMADYQSYYQAYSEECLYTKHGIAGTTDKVLLVSKGANSLFDLEDFKTNLSKGIENYNKYNKYFIGPISHLFDCNFNQYILQLSMYAYMLEELTGRRIRSLWIRYIPPQDRMQHVRMPVPYMKKEIEAMIHHWLGKKVSPNAIQKELINDFNDEPIF